jgi:protein-S-isoprenylcysteine O-methyltransferase Ste14
MPGFLIPLIAGFASHLASAFTTSFSEKWGKRTGTFITILLRDIFGIPLWAYGYVMAIQSDSYLLYPSSSFSTTAGWLTVGCGSIIIIIALLSIRTKAAAPTTDDTLVKKGIYSLVRHPIHSGTFLEFAGLLILWPTINVAIAFLAGTLWIYFQSRLEEKDLLKRIPDYGEYMKRVKRFFPFPQKAVHEKNK